MASFHSPLRGNFASCLANARLRAPRAPPKMHHASFCVVKIGFNGIGSKILQKVSAGRRCEKLLQTFLCPPFRQVEVSLLPPSRPNVFGGCESANTLHSLRRIIRLVWERRRTAISPQRGCLLGKHPRLRKARLRHGHRSATASRSCQPSFPSSFA